jgi:hypothetical protein
MGKINIHAGDFVTGNFSNFMFGKLMLAIGPVGFLGPKLEHIDKSNVCSIEEETEESVAKWGGAIGWGAAGAVLLGPLGFALGAVLGGRGKDVTFTMKLKDGRKILATTDSKTFIGLKSIVF